MQEIIIEDCSNPVEAYYKNVARLFREAELFSREVSRLVNPTGEISKMVAMKRIMEVCHAIHKA